ARPRRARTRGRPRRRGQSAEIATSRASRDQGNGLRGRRRRALGRDLVAHAPHGDDRRRVSELPPDLADVHVDGACVTRERVAPYALQELVAGEHDPAMIEQLPEEVELLGGEPDLLVADVDLALPGVDRELAVAKLRALALASLRSCAAEHALDAGDELPRADRLLPPVVPSDLEPDDLVDV